MSQRTKVTGTGSCTLWLLALIAIVLVAVVATGGVFILPRVQTGQMLEQRYQAGVAFQNVNDWAAAETDYRQVIVIDANYKDVQTRLAEVRTKMQVVTATAVALAQATAVAAPAATSQALEARYQKGLGYMNMGRWQEAKAELEQVFAVNPNYKDVQTRLKDVEAMVARLVPTATLTPRPTATPEIRSPSVRWLGLIGDQVSPSGTGTAPDGKADGVFELLLPDVGRTVIHILLQTPDGYDHWDTDGQESWVLGVLDQDSGRRLDKLGTSMNYLVERPVKLRLYGSVSQRGFQSGNKYMVTVRFADGYSFELSVQIP